jgi:hypothetical protein
MRDANTRAAANLTLADEMIASAKVMDEDIVQIRQDRLEAMLASQSKSRNEELTIYIDEPEWDDNIRSPDQFDDDADNADDDDEGREGEFIVGEDEEEQDEEDAPEHGTGGKGKGKGKAKAKPKGKQSPSLPLPQPV